MNFMIIIKKIETIFTETKKFILVMEILRFFGGGVLQEA